MPRWTRNSSRACVAAPVYGFCGDVLAAITLSAPKQRLGNHLRGAGNSPAPSPFRCRRRAVPGRR
ncbi:hypothetical protein GZH49_23335 [Nocardia terpenica]